MNTNSIAHTLATYDAIHAAIRTASPLPILYATGGDIIKARTIQPLRIMVGTQGSDLIVAHDSIRQGVITFRIDRVVATA
jgi:hypothetical protein